MSRSNKILLSVCIAFVLVTIFAAYKDSQPEAKKFSQSSFARHNRPVIIPRTSSERAQSLAQIRRIQQEAQNATSTTSQPPTIATTSTPSSPRVTTKPSPVRADAAYAILLDSERSKSKVLFSKNADVRYSIASISKLMALVTSDLSASATTSVTISSSTLAIYPKDTLFHVGQTWTKSDLLGPIVVASNNVAVQALSEIHGVSSFVSTMNSIATELGMTKTSFVNATGLDQEKNSKISYNVSSAKDLSILGTYLILNRPDILELSTLKEYSFTTEQGVAITLKSTNVSLSDPRIPWKIIGGKTGTTDSAAQTLILITESPFSKQYIISVLLHSPNRVEDVASLLRYIQAEQKW